jgi:hypothetical protein
LKEKKINGDSDHTFVRNFRKIHAWHIGENCPDGKTEKKFQSDCKGQHPVNWCCPINRHDCADLRIPLVVFYSAQNHVKAGIENGIVLLHVRNPLLSETPSMIVRKTTGVGLV